VIWKSEDLPDEHIASPSRKWEIALDLRGQTGIPDHQKGKGDSGFFIWRASFLPPGRPPDEAPLVPALGFLVDEPCDHAGSGQGVVAALVPGKPPPFYIRAKNRLEVWIQLGLTR